MLINDPNREPCRLAPPKAFSNELAPEELRRRLQPDRPADRIEARSETAARVFASRCAGDVRPPTAAELCDAMRRDEPTEREQSVLCSWILHATVDDLWWAKRIIAQKTAAAPRSGGGQPKKAVPGEERRA